MRAAWREMVSGKVEPKRFVFVDEMGTNTSLSALYAWSQRGERAWSVRCLATEGRIPPCFRAWALRVWERLWQWWVAPPPEVFEVYVEKVLAPSLLRGGQSLW